MAQVSFTQNLRQHLAAPPRQIAGTTVREALDVVFDENPRLRGYVLDDQARLRKHVVIFIDGKMIEDRIELSDPIGDSSELYVMQALSGG